MDEPESVPVSMASLLKSRAVVPIQKSRKTERGELLRYFSQKTRMPIPLLCGRHIPAGLTLEDLYFMKSNADAYEREGKGPWTKAFFGSLKLPEQNGS